MEQCFLNNCLSDFVCLLSSVVHVGVATHILILGVEEQEVWYVSMRAQLELARAKQLTSCSHMFAIETFEACCSPMQKTTWSASTVTFSYIELF